MLKSVPFHPGINNEIFDNIKVVVDKIKNNFDKYCNLIFYEISLYAGFNYNERNDRLIGLKDLGDDVRTDHIADKTLTFMILGVRKMFKQPFAYYFTNLGIKLKNWLFVLKM